LTVGDTFRLAWEYAEETERQERWCPAQITAEIVETYKLTDLVGIFNPVLGVFEAKVSVEYVGSKEDNCVY